MFFFFCSKVLFWSFFRHEHHENKEKALNPTRTLDVLAGGRQPLADHGSDGLARVRQLLGVLGARRVHVGTVGRRFHQNGLGEKYKE